MPANLLILLQRLILEFQYVITDNLDPFLQQFQHLFRFILKINVRIKTVLGVINPEELFGIIRGIIVKSLNIAQLRTWVISCLHIYHRHFDVPDIFQRRHLVQRISSQPDNPLFNHRHHQFGPCLCHKCTEIST